MVNNLMKFMINIKQNIKMKINGSIKYTFKIMNLMILFPKKFSKSYMIINLLNLIIQLKILNN